MSNKITGKEYPLSKVFDADFEYHIPGYQRPYAWTEEEMCDIMTPTNRNLYIKENIDETVFMFALFKCRKSDKGRN